MTVPVIISTTRSGNNTASTSWAVSYPAYNTGDMLVFNVGSDGAATHTFPGSGPNSETIVTIRANHATASNETASAFYFVATAGASSGSLTVTGSVAEEWQAQVCRVEAGSFNTTTPIDSSATGGSSTFNNMVSPSPSWTATSGAAGGAVMAFLVVDQDTIGTATGWTNLDNNDIGQHTTCVARRDTNATASETIASAEWANLDDGDTTSSIGYVITAADESAKIVTESLYYVASRLDSKSNIEWTVREGHTGLDGALLGSGLTGTTSATGVFIPNGTNAFGAINDPVTLSLYWEEGNPAVDRSLIVKTTLVAA